MATITAGETVLNLPVLRGTVLDAARATEIHERAGEDGSEAVDLGLREQESVLESVATALNAAEAEIAKAAHQALAGRIATIVDGHGSEHLLVLIVSVDVTISACANPIGPAPTDPSHTKLLRTRWTVRKLLDTGEPE